MREDFGAGAVFEITDVDEFSIRLASHPKLLQRSFLTGPVSYIDRVAAQSVTELAPVDPFLKASDFSWQREYRLVWSSHLGEPALILEVPEVASLLRRLPWER